MKSRQTLLRFSARATHACPACRQHSKCRGIWQLQLPYKGAAVVITAMAVLLAFAPHPCIVPDTHPCIKQPTVTPAPLPCSPVLLPAFLCTSPPHFAAHSSHTPHPLPPQYLSCRVSSIEGVDVALLQAQLGDLRPAVHSSTAASLQPICALLAHPFLTSKPADQSATPHGCCVPPLVLIRPLNTAHHIPIT